MKSSLNMSRTTRMSRSGSSYTSVGAGALGVALAAFALDDLPLRGQAVDVAFEVGLATPSAAVRMITPDSSGTIRLRISLSRLRSVSGSLRLIPVAPPRGHEDQEAAGQADLGGQARALVADRVLGDLHEHLVAGGQRLLDLALLALEARGVPVDLAGVEHGVAPAPDVDERRLHRRQHVLHAAEVDVADHRVLALAGDEVLDEHAVLEDPDLAAPGLLAHDHRALDGLAAGEELGLGQDRRAPAAGVAAVAAALALGLQPRGALDPAHLVVRRLPPSRPAPRSRTWTTVFGGSSTAVAVALAVGADRRRRRRRRREPPEPCSSSSVVAVVAPSAPSASSESVVGASASSARRSPRPSPSGPRRRRRRRRATTPAATPTPAAPAAAAVVLVVVAVVAAGVVGPCRGSAVVGGGRVVGGRRRGGRGRRPRALGPASAAVVASDAGRGLGGLLGRDRAGGAAPAGGAAAAGGSSAVESGARNIGAAKAGARPRGAVGASTRGDRGLRATRPASRPARRAAPGGGLGGRARRRARAAGNMSSTTRATTRGRRSTGRCGRPRRGG